MVTTDIEDEANCSRAISIADEDDSTYESPLDMRLGDYSCKFVTNIPIESNNDASNPRTYFDLGLRHFFAYHQ